MADDSPLQPEGITLLPSGIVGDGSITVQQQASWGMPMQQPWEWQPAAAAATRRLVQQVQQLQGQEGDWQEGRDAQKQPGPLSGARWAELQVGRVPVGEVRFGCWHRLLGIGWAAAVCLHHMHTCHCRFSLTKAGVA